MSPKQKQEILDKTKVFFHQRIVASHRANIEKLHDPKKFKINPLVLPYLAQLLCGNSSPESLAKALIYPRVLSTSITTIFGAQMQFFCSEVLEGFASKISGIDLEFVDFSDGRKKYCQLKFGPNTINKDDVTTIVDKFSGIRNLARTNKATDLNYNDLIVGVAYGSEKELSSHYRKIRDIHNFPVLVGKEFWHRLTGEETFYEELVGAFAAAAKEIKVHGLLDRVAKKLAPKLKSEN